MRADFPPGIRVREGELEVGGRKGIPGPLRPLDQAHAFSMEVVCQTRIAQFVRIYESIKIKVVQV